MNMISKPEHALRAVQDGWVRAEADKIFFIYGTLYPQRKIRLFLYRTDDHAWGAPTVIEGPLALAPAHWSSDLIGIFEAGTSATEQEEVNVFCSVPRRPTPAELAASPEPAIMRSRTAKILFRLSPMTFERVKFRLERRMFGKSLRRDAWQKLPRPRLKDHSQTSPARSHEKRPAILIGMHWLETGGAEKLAFDAIGWALEAGLRVFVLTEARGLHRLAHKLPDHPDLKFVRTDRYLPNDKMALFLNRLVEQENIRLLHIHHCIPLYEALPTLKALHSDLTVVDSTHIVEYANGGYPRISGVWSNFIDHHHVISRDLIEMFRTRFLVRGKVQLGRMIHREEVAADGPSFSMRPGKKRYSIAFVGRMGHQKRPVLLALIMKALRDWGQQHEVEFRFEIVGEGPYLQAVKALFVKYGLEGAVKLHPAHADIPQIMRDADILILPSSNEGLALVCYEAIAHGTIPISTDVGGQGELLPRELLVDPEPQKAVGQTVETVARLIAEPAFIDRVTAGLRSGYGSVSSDPSAYECLMPLYQAAAGK